MCFILSLHLLMSSRKIRLDLQHRRRNQGEIFSALELADFRSLDGDEGIRGAVEINRLGAPECHGYLKKKKPIHS